MLDGGGEMKTIGNLEAEPGSGTDSSGALANRRRQRQNANRRTGKESLVIGEDGRITSGERGDQTLRAAKIADSDFVAGAPQRGKPRHDFRTHVGSASIR